MKRKRESTEMKFVKDNQTNENYFSRNKTKTKRKRVKNKKNTRIEEKWENKVRTQEFCIYQHDKRSQKVVDSVNMKRWLTHTQKGGSILYYLIKRKNHQNDWDESKTKRNTVKKTIYDFFLFREREIETSQNDQVCENTNSSFFFIQKFISAVRVFCHLLYELCLVTMSCRIFASMSTLESKPFIQV